MSDPVIESVAAEVYTVPTEAPSATAHSRGM